MEQAEIKIRINELEKVLKESYGSHHWIKSRLEELKAIQVKAEVGMPSETLSCEQNCHTCCYHGNCPIESATYSMSIKRPFSCSEFAIEP